jgi:hypothetical protein
MRVRILTIALIAAMSAGCATGIRVGGERYGAGVGGFIGPVPQSVVRDSYLMPPVMVER